MFEKIKNILITVIIATTAAMFWTGCGLAAAPVGVAGVASSETASEKVTPAEFKLGATKGKIAVVISQPSWIKTPMDLRITLTEAINAALEEKANIKKERLIPYTDVQKCRMALPEDKRDDPFEITSKLNAQYVLTVQITDFDLSTFAEEDFFNGTMITKSCLFDANSNKLWPQDANDNCRQIAVGLETEKGTVKTSVEKLCAATAHCITRYFYNCKAAHFRIAEEQREFDNYTW
ncbi:MAG: hypothetical protein ABSE89_07545 [Sedimentisphaerales bacterium]